MTDTELDKSQDDEPDQNIATVTRDDLATVHLEAPIHDSKKVDCWSLSDLYRAASSQHKQSGNETAARVFGLVSKVACMHFKPEDRTEPYGPMFVMNGRRSIIPADLRGDQSEVFAAIAVDIENPGLRARLSDVAWLNNRKLSTMAKLAINAYCDAVQAVLDSKAEFSHDSRTASSHEGSKMLHRACQIARATGWKDPEGTRLKSLVPIVTRDAFNREDHRGFFNIAELCLQYRINDPVTLASQAEKLVSTNDPDPFTSRELWELAAFAHRQSGNDSERDRCLIAGAECLVSLADAEGDRGMNAASHLMDAIEALRQIPKTRERRQQLETRLREAQASIDNELSVITTEIDLTQLVQEARRSVGGITLAQSLRTFAQLANSPNPDALRDQTRKQAQKNPLSTLIPTSMLDDEGKVIAKSPGFIGDGEDGDDALHHLIARNEGMRRLCAVKGRIDPARILIHSEHPLDQRDFLPLVLMSPFVPADRTDLFSLAFARFFGGDFISALHILVPQLENSLRYILKQAGKQPSSIRSDMIQEDRNLSVLLKKDRESLEAIFAPAIVYEIENLFDIRGGPSLRHQLAHGLISGEASFGTDAIYACWFIFRLCCLHVFDHWDKLAERMDGNQGLHRASRPHSPSNVVAEGTENRCPPIDPANT